MWKKAALEGMDSAAIEERSQQLKEVSKQFRSVLRDAGLIEGNCKTICEERLVVVNGRLETQIVCRTICTP